MRRTILAGSGVALVVAAVATPLAAWGEHRSFAAHMAQHLLLGDLAPLLVALAFGARTPLHPALAFPVWAANLFAWHVPAVYEAALHHEPVHVLQHTALLAAAAVLWGSILSSHWGAPLRLGALAGMMIASLALATLLLWWPRVAYSTYRDAHTLGGISALSDQRLGGGMMLLEGSIVSLTVAGLLIVQQLQRSAPRPAAGDAYPSP